jgi:hypothetical protein
VGGVDIETVADVLAVPPAPLQARVNVLEFVNAPLDWVPEVALAPDQPPEAVQAVALVDDQVSVEDPPLEMELGFAVSDTVGAATGAAVVKFQLKFAASALPAASLAAAVMVAVYCVPAARDVDGVKVAAFPLTFTVPVTAVPLVVASLTLAVVSVALVMASEKVAEIVAFVATAVAAFAGDVKDTVGGVVSGAAPVVNVQVKSAGRGLPAASVTPAATVAVY